MEVAETMVGGHEKLMAAIRRGAVRVTGGENGAVEMFHFPSIKHGSLETMAAEQTIRREKDTTKGAWAAVAECADKMSWAIIDPEASQALADSRGIYTGVGVACVFPR